MKAWPAISTRESNPRERPAAISRVRAAAMPAARATRIPTSPPAITCRPIHPAILTAVPAAPPIRPPRPAIKTMAQITVSSFREQPATCP